MARGLRESQPRIETDAVRTIRFLDERLGTSDFLRRSINKIFPDNWSFMLGEIALYSFIVLVLTGTYLGFFFKPGDDVMIYHGSYVPLKGLEVSRAYDSTLNISFDVRAGLLFRQIHHWAALLFVASIVVHACRIFFTGAFRKPRELNWMIGVALLVLAIGEGFAGYSLPNDSLSGTGLRIAYSIVESIPLIGTYVAFFLWGGDFPGTVFNDRLFFLHVLIIPGVIIALITAHMGILWHQKHTDFPGPGKNNDSIVGERLYPVYAMKSAGLFATVFGVLALLGGLAQINPIWLYGPFKPSEASTAAQPDWYVGFLEGALRLMPPWEFRGVGHDIPFNVFIPAVALPGLLFTAMALYPFLERRFTRSQAIHHQLSNPREHPVRTGIGAMALSFYFILLLAGGDDVLATTFNISIEALRNALRAALLLVPPIVYKLAASWCRGLMQDDDEEIEEGIETGRIILTSGGEYIEPVQPLAYPEVPEWTPHDERTPPSYVPPAIASTSEGNGRFPPPGRNGQPDGEALPTLRHAIGVAGRAGRAVSSFFLKDEDS
jgi:ubiquinol-cytochrome c reductase cytochrome b subunit